ncbi:uncharacterized protein N7459_008839 [Penicillium hispanicum]|uniref:uncharacterized protein n=1 Tax=Penicillium hispanicum TaxID=1080232 RepID=UPI002541E7FB|nr:uncharacterized protein N7459_008839 [Penicillium hispanicum]KAJ5569409.1 hypothetical protein N7459_008839 [Penicillium hispanicum]
MLLSSLAKTQLDLILTLPFNNIINSKGYSLNIFLQYINRDYLIIASSLTSLTSLNSLLVLLLDKADTFIEVYTSYYNNHNRLITIFLRKLEYYKENFPLNRREIKNLLSIRHTLTTVKKQQISYKHLEIAAELNKKLSEKFSQESHIKSIYI